VLTGTFEAWQEDGSFGSEGKSDGEWAEDVDGSSLEDEDGWGHFNVRTGKFQGVA
jgi:hypothetical protein